MPVMYDGLAQRGRYTKVGRRSPILYWKNDSNHVRNGPSHSDVYYYTGTTMPDGRMAWLTPGRRVFARASEADALAPMCCTYLTVIVPTHDDASIIAIDDPKGEPFMLPPDRIVGLSASGGVMDLETVQQLVQSVLQRRAAQEAASKSQCGSKKHADSTTQHRHGTCNLALATPPLRK